MRGVQFQKVLFDAQQDFSDQRSGVLAPFEPLHRSDAEPDRRERRLDDVRRAQKICTNMSGAYEDVSRERARSLMEHHRAIVSKTESLKAVVCAAGTVRNAAGRHMLRSANARSGARWLTRSLLTTG